METVPENIFLSIAIRLLIGCIIAIFIMGVGAGFLWVINQETGITDIPLIILNFIVIIPLFFLARMILFRIMKLK